MFRSISRLVCLAVFWVLLSGFFTPFLLAAGLGSALAVVWFARRMDVVDDEGHPIRLGARALVYRPPEFDTKRCKWLICLEASPSAATTARAFERWYRAS